jgi:ATP-binding cassette subfamily B protein
MRHQLRTEPPSENRSDWKTIKTLIPSLWEYRYRIGLALLLLALAKLANIGVPLALKEIIDTLDFSTDTPTPMVALPLALLIGYGLLRLSTSLFNELRAAVFARASQSAIRKISLKVFHHLHHLSLRFHLDRQTGGISRDIERGSRSTGQLLNYLIFSILPTLFEISVVCGILLYNYPWPYAAITLITVISYYLYTYKVTTWRTQFRIKMNEMDSRANTAAIDSLINYETVKYLAMKTLNQSDMAKTSRSGNRPLLKAKLPLPY